jgi:hypothetical protein
VTVRPCVQIAGPRPISEFGVAPANIVNLITLLYYKAMNESLRMLGAYGRGGRPTT